MIRKIKARQILDSRGTPTIEVEISTDDFKAVASVPSGKSKSSFEAVELRDNTKEFFGKSVKKAVDNINRIIAKRIIGMRPTSQELIDGTMIRLDGTINKSRLGANAILAVSIAVAKLAAKQENIPLWQYINNLFGRKTKPKLPTPFANIINGGVHAGNDLTFQEFMIAPIKIRSMEDKIRAIVEVYYTLKHILEKKYGKSAINVGDEGGFAPPLKNPEEALNLIEEAIEEAGYKNKVFPALDVAANEIKRNEKYVIEKRKRKFSSRELIDYYRELIRKYKIISIEDPFSENDYEAWNKFTNRFGKRIQIVGDDLLATNPLRIEFAIEKKLCNALLLKINQIGTLSEAIEAARLAYSNNWGIMVSHRSGETNDSFIVHLAVGLGCGQIKIGAPVRGERVAKYNELLRISETLKT